MPVDADLAAMLARAAQEGAAAMLRTLEAEGRLGPARAAAPVAPPAANRTLLELWLEYLQGLPREKHGRRAIGEIRRSYTLQLQRQFVFRGRTLTLAELKPPECTPALLKAWQDFMGTAPKLRGKGTYPPSTVDQVRMSFQAMFTNFVRLKELTDNPFAVVPRPDGRKRRRMGCPTWEQTCALAAEMPTVSGYLVRHEFRTMCRKNDLRLLRKTQIHWQTKDLAIRVKGGKEVLIACPTDVMEDLELLCKMSRTEYVYANQRNGQPISEKALWSQLRKASKKTGLEEMYPGEKTTHHHFRHGGANDKVDKMPLHMLKDQLAHQDIQTTEIYLGMRSQMRAMIQERMDLPPGPLPLPSPKR